MDSQTSLRGPRRGLCRAAGAAAGLNKYATEQTCRQLGPDTAVCPVEAQGERTRRRRDVFTRKIKVS